MGCYLKFNQNYVVGLDFNVERSIKNIFRIHFIIYEIKWLLLNKNLPKNIINNNLE
jgi:hypothetical protein